MYGGNVMTMRTFAGLTCRVIAPAGNAPTTGVVVLLHGFGAPGNDLVALGDYLDLPPGIACVFPEAPPADLVPSCAEAGVLGALAGAVGSLQAVEAIKEVLGIGRSLSGRLLLYDALEASVRIITIPRDPACPLCGEHPKILNHGH